MSTTGVAPRLALQGPLPVAPEFNIFTVALDLNDPAVQAQMGLDMEFRWRAGVTVWPYPSDLPSGFDSCNESATNPVGNKDDGSDNDDDLQTFEAFTAYVPEFCTSYGIGDWERFKARANSVLLATDAYAAERQLAKGLPMDGNPSLNDTHLTDLGAGSAVGPIEALALLENAGGATARQYVIHATPAAASAWSANRMLLWTGDVIRTVATRTPVIVGTGYIGTDPDSAAGPAGDTDWAFVTGPVFAARGELEELTEDISEALDRSNNDLVYRAERDILVGWDGVLQAGVRVDRSATP